MDLILDLVGRRIASAARGWAALPNIARIGTRPAEGRPLKQLVRRVSVIGRSSSTAAQVQDLVDPAVPVIIDDRALDRRVIRMLGAVLAQHDGDDQTETSRLRGTAWSSGIRGDLPPTPCVQAKASRRPGVTRVSPPGGIG